MADTAPSGCPAASSTGPCSRCTSRYCFTCKTMHNHSFAFQGLDCCCKRSFPLQILLQTMFSKEVPSFLVHSRTQVAGMACVSLVHHHLSSSPLQADRNARHLAIESPGLEHGYVRPATLQLQIFVPIDSHHESQFLRARRWCRGAAHVMPAAYLPTECRCRRASIAC